MVAQVEDVTVDRRFQWLRSGWRDLRRAPAARIGYGTLFTTASYLVTPWMMANPTFFFLFLPLLFGFFLVAPALAVGPYETSRRPERGEKPYFGLAIGLPSIGHATLHACRDLVHH